MGQDVCTICKDCIAMRFTHVGSPIFDRVPIEAEAGERLKYPRKICELVPMTAR